MHSSFIRQMSVEEFEGSLPRQTRGLGRIIFPLVAIESMPRIVVEYWQGWMASLDCLDFCRRDVRISSSEMHHDGAARNFRSVLGNPTTVITHSGGGIEP